MTQRLTEKITFGKKSKITNQPIVTSLNLIEVIHNNKSTTILTSQDAFSNILDKELLSLRNTPSNRICVLDLHNTLDVLTTNDENIKKLKNLRSKYNLVVALSFVGKADGPGSTRYGARLELMHNISQGIIDFGILVFKREYAKGIICDLLFKKFGDHHQIIFSDDGDDHLDAVKDILGNNKLNKNNIPILGSIHKSIPFKPTELMDWLHNQIEDNKST